MESIRAKVPPVGSMGWIENEREHVSQLVEQEAEEFGYSVRNELEWLQEHMSDIFHRSNVNFADVFKTPGKLRGKTPKTARKLLKTGPRQPLGDIFGPNVAAPPSAQKTPFFAKVAQFRIAEDAEDHVTRPASRSKSPQRIGKNINTDSGYHGMTEDEMELDAKTETATLSSQQSFVQKVPLREDPPPPQRLNDVSVEGGTSDDSFMSAKEDVTSRNASKEQLRESEAAEEVVPEAKDAMEVDEKIHVQPEIENEAVDQDHDSDIEESHSQSDASSPGKPLQRKSSFTFTALPARDTLGNKMSLGARNSQVDPRDSTLGRSFGAKGVEPENIEDDETHTEDKSEESKAHNKTSTQLLHEKINMLGKTKEPRTSRSLHQSVLGAQTAYPQLPVGDPSKSAQIADPEESEDDWIAPSKPAQMQQASSERPPMHQKSISTTQIPSPTRLEMVSGARQLKAQSVSNPNFTSATAQIQSTTPAGSPASKKNLHDGPLSASKNKLYSVLKSAKSIFASSASASAAAKLEAHNNSPSRTPRREVSDESKTAAVFNMPGALYSQMQLPQSPSRTKSVISLVSTSPSRKTRSSTESEKKREKELKAQQKAADDLEKAREKERQKAAKQQEEKVKAEQAEAARKERLAQKQLPERPTTAESDRADMPPPPPPKGMLGSGKLRAPGRIIKPSQQAARATRPAPVSIRVASQSQRMHHAPSSSMSKSQHESSAPAAPSMPPMTRPVSSQSSVRSSTAPTNSRVRALEAAARKKEADEKAAQKKAEQKREMERKRAAKAEEERRAEEERKVAEQQRVQEAKQAAQRQAEKQAEETRRREDQRREMQRLEQLRQQEEAQSKQAAHEMAEAIRLERLQKQASQQRNDVGGTLRQLAKNVMAEVPVSRPPIQPNPAKPAKRVWAPDDEEPTQPQTHQPQRPGLQRGPASFQQQDAKRRRTNEEEKPEERNSVMAPPKRPSNMRKESVLNKFPNGYTHAPPPTNHHPSMFKATVTAQHQLQHAGKPVLAQVSSARIPFAENVNPPAHPQHHNKAQHPGHENVHPSQQNSKFKTPARPAQAPKSAKSSPLYPNGDAIELPDIETDSEDEDDSEDENTGFRAPSWVASPALRDLLTQQQLVDPETIFGPIGELRMEEVFKGGKNPERVKRFRDRSSSALWTQFGDAVTSAEKRRDMEARERVVREGGWRYEGGGGL